MSNSLLIGLLISGGLLICVLVGYVVGKRSVRAGIAIATTGLLLGVVLIVNYFEEVPVAIVASSFAAVAASLLFALFEVVRKDAIPNPH